MHRWYRHGCQAAALGLAFAACAPHGATSPLPASAEPVLPITRSWPVLGTRFEATAWEADTVVAARSLEAAHAALERTAATAAAAPASTPSGDLLARAAREPGVRLDPAAAARGAVLDSAVEAMRAAGAARGQLALGPDVRVFGSAPPGADVWGVGIMDPRNPTDVLAVVTLDSGAVSTAAGVSAAAEPGAGAGLPAAADSTAGRAAGGTVGGPAVAAGASVTVWAPNAATAAALARAFLAAGPDEGCGLARRLGVEAFWIRGGGGQARTLVATPGFLERLQLPSDPSLRPPIPARCPG